MAYPPVEGCLVVHVIVVDFTSILFKFVFLEDSLLHEGLDIDLL